MYVSVEVLDFRLDCVEGTGSSDVIDDNLVLDFILPMTCCSWYIGSDRFHNSQTVGFQDREGRSIVLGNKFDLVVGGQLCGGNKGFLIAELIVLYILYLNKINHTRRICGNTTLFKTLFPEHYLKKFL